MGGIKKMKIIAVIIGIVAVGAIAAGAVYTGLIEIPGMPGIPARAIDAVPSGANVVGVANWNRMINDPDVQSLTDKFLDVMGEEDSFDDIYDELKDEVEDELGINIDEISSGVFFGKIEESMYSHPYSEPDYLGVILEGDFDKEEVIDKFEEEFDDVDEKTHNGVDVYIASEEKPEVAIAEMDNFLVFGTKRAVFDSIDAKKDRDERLKGELKDMFGSVDGNFIK